MKISISSIYYKILDYLAYFCVYFIYFYSSATLTSYLTSYLNFYVYIGYFETALLILVLLLVFVYLALAGNDNNIFYNNNQNNEAFHKYYMKTKFGYWHSFETYFIKISTALFSFVFLRNNQIGIIILINTILGNILLHVIFSSYENYIKTKKQ